MLFENRPLPMNDGSNNNLIGTIILTAILVGGVGYMMYASKKNNSLTNNTKDSHEKRS